MKRFPLLFSHAVLVGAALFAFCSSGRGADPQPAPPPPDLPVYVDVPPSWRPFLDDDIAEAFASRVQRVFRQRGYAGRIALVPRRDEPKPAPPLLEIRLLEWRIGRTGNAECTFSATLQTATGQKSLGLIAHTAIFWPSRGGRWGLGRAQESANALDDAAERALRELYQRVAETALIPGLAVKH